jgi:hypothetical protein
MLAEDATDHAHDHDPDERLARVQSQALRHR